MKALVTGGAGFIGSNVVKKLLEHNFEVTVYDNLSSGYYCNIQLGIENKDIKFIEGDILDSEKLFQACVGGYDVVFHLAASVGRQRSIDDPIMDSKINLIGTVNVLEAMQKNAIPKVIYSSSAAIFGELISTNIDENHPQNADSPYGVSKLAAEKMVLAYSGIYPMTGICLRYFNVYGINQRYDLYGNVIPIFAKRIYSNEPLVIYGDGEQTRDFLNVSDIANANYLGFEKGLKSEVYNLGSGNAITINVLARKMIEIAGKKCEIIYKPERPADVKHCRAETNRAKEHLGFESKVLFEEGLTEYMKWYRDNCVL